MDPVRVGSIGLGWWGERLAAAGERAGLDVAACYARNDRSRDGFAAKHDCRSARSLDDLFADDSIDALLVATPHSTHTDLIDRAAAAGKHVFVEKPLTLTVAEGRQAVEAAESAGVVLQVGHNRRRQPANRRLKQMVDDGEFGTIHYLEAQLSNPMNLIPKTGWRADPDETPAGGMTALGVHMIDTLTMLMGRPSRIAAMSEQVLAHTAVDDVTTAILQYPSGAMASLTTSMVVPTVARVAVFGTQASAWNEDDGEKFYRQASGDAERRREDIETLDTVEDELAEFASAVRGERQPEVDGRTALDVVASLQALITSTAERRFVDLQELADT